jgi:uncharacterized protein (UPF0216 family)
MAMKLSLYTMRPMHCQETQRHTCVQYRHTRSLQTTVNLLKKESRPQFEFPTAMTYEEFDKRAVTIRTKLRVWQVKSDMALQQKQREANQAELQTVVQKQLRARSGTLNSQSPPTSTNDLQRPDGMKYMTARQKRDMIMAQLHRMLICAGINVLETGFSGWLAVLQVTRAIQHSLIHVREH